MSNTGRRSAEPGSSRIDAAENGADRGKLDTSQDVARNPLTAGMDRMPRHRAAGHEPDAHPGQQK
jgi:hypothetical protein